MSDINHPNIVRYYQTWVETETNKDKLYEAFGTSDEESSEEEDEYDDEEESKYDKSRKPS